MMEQPRSLLDKRNPQFVRGIQHQLIILATRRRSNVFCAGAVRAEDVVNEGELHKAH